MPEASKNEIHFDYANNPELAEILSGKRVGDKCTLEVTFKMKEVNEKMAIGVITNVTSDYEGDEKTAEPGPEKPMMVEMRPALPNG